MRRILFLSLLLAPAGWAQEEGCDEGGDSVIEISCGPEAGRYDVEIDPFAEPAPEEVAEPNRPEPIRVGEWEPPELAPPLEAERLALEARRGETPNDVHVRYRLAQFYLDTGWYEHAEAELHRCAALDPDGLRPWEMLITLYRACLEGGGGGGDELDFVAVNGGWRAVRPGRKRGKSSSWLSANPQAEANRRISKAYLELLARRPDDLARRREFVKHLEALRDHPRIVEQARAVLAQMPADSDTRYLLSESLRILASLNPGAKGEGPGRGEDPPEWVRLLQEVVEADPSHVRASLRLARVLAVQEGVEAAERIRALEQRAFFHLFQKSEIAPVAYREDVYRMAIKLAGPGVARRLWDDAMTPPSAAQNGGERPRFDRWLEIKFSHSMPRERADVIRVLARRGDEGAAAMLVSFLWHLEDYELYNDGAPADRNIAMEAEEEAVAAVAKLGGIAFGPAERFLAAASSDAHRRRAVQVLRRMREPRAVAALIPALAFDIREQASFGVAAALEELGDPRAINGLVEAALDSRRPVARRREAAEALASFQDPRAIDAIHALRKDPQFALVGAYALFRLTGDAAALAQIEAQMADGGDRGGALRLAAKCRDPRLEGLFLSGLANADEEARPAILEILRERYWATAQPRVKDLLLKEAESPGVGPFALRVLGEIGGDDVAVRLAQLVERLDGEAWVAAARAYAETGDAEAVRYFGKLKILSKDASRRKLAEELHDRAAKRQAQRTRAPAGQ